MADLLPPNASALEHRLDVSFEESIDLPVNISPVWNPATCPIEMLPHLAWGFSVDFWDEDWPEEDKRQVVALSLQVHRHKGTPGAVKDALRAAGYGEVDIIDGLDARTRDGSVLRDGRYFHSTYRNWALFRLIVHKPVSIKQAAQIRTICDRTRREVCKLLAVHFDRALNLHNAVIYRDGSFTRGIIDGEFA